MRKLLAFVFCVAVAPLAAEYMISEIVNVPVERLTTNLERQIREKPNDVSLRVSLGRLYAMTYAINATELPATKGPEGYEPHEDQQPQSRVPPTPKPASAGSNETARRANLTKAILAYRRALTLEATNVIANLGLGWCLQQSGDLKGAIEAYRRTIEAAWVSEQTRGVGLAAQSVTEEAAGYLIPLLNPVTDAFEIDRLRQRIKTINARPRYITPIAIPLRDHLDAQDLLNRTASVAFDADGSGLRKPWTWITPNAGWLVYDRRNSGQVSSALQLFGNVTFWLFWQNGYEPLRALDDNFDGSISGAELECLSIWRDENSDGISQTGEVKPLAQWNIVALSYEHTRHAPSDDGMVYSPRGVTFADGSTRPTFDLILNLRPSSERRDTATW